MFFNIVKDFCKSIEGLSRSGKVQIGSKAEGIIVLGCLRLKYLTRCQISPSNTIFIQFNKVFFNIVKDLFKSIEGLSRSGKVQIGSKAQGIIVLGCLR